MTLIVALANLDYTVLVSDRRFTVNGKLEDDRDDERNKAATFLCDDARLAIAFSGFARAGTFGTEEWLLEALPEAAKPDHLIFPTITRLADRATVDFKKLQVDSAKKRLSLVLAGYHYAEETPRSYCWLVSNCEGLKKPNVRAIADQEFRAEYWREARPRAGPLAGVLMFGVTDAIPHADGARLHQLLLEGKPAETLVGNSVRVLRSAAASPRAGKLIGKQATSIILPSDPAQEAIADYHSAVPTAKEYGPNHMVARSDVGFQMKGFEAEHLDASGSPVLVVPRTGRNKPCPCGSGRKFKHCHGRR